MVSRPTVQSVQRDGVWPGVRWITILIRARPHDVVRNPALSDPARPSTTEERTDSVDVSVVVPVFNAMPYLREFLESLAAQDLPDDAYEVVAVNDGSTDGSGAELDAFAERHPNVRVVHQENTGWPGGPRNRGSISPAAGTCSSPTPTTGWEPRRSDAWSRSPTSTARTSSCPRWSA